MARKYSPIRQRLHDRLVKEVTRGAEVIVGVSGVSPQSLINSPKAAHKLRTDPGTIQRCASHPSIQDAAGQFNEPPAAFWVRSVENFCDFQVLSFMLREDCQTVIFQRDHAIYLSENLERFDLDRLGKLPFDPMLIQFDTPMPEGIIFEQEKHLDIAAMADDHVVGIAIASFEGEYRATALFSSGANNHIVFSPTDPMIRRISTGPMPDVNQRNKHKLRALAIGCLSFLQADNVELERRDPHAKQNQKRLRKGRKPFEGYYVSRITKTYGPSGGSTGAGASHSHMYPVRGHLRKMSGGGTIWIAPHWRGLEHGEDSKKERVMVAVPQKGG